MRAAVDVEHLSKTRARLAPPAMPPAHARFLEQSGGLQGLLHETVGERHPVLAPRNLMKVAAIESPVPLSIEAQHLRHGGQRDASRGRRAPPMVDQPAIAFPLIALPPAAERSRTHPENLSRLEPVQLAADRLQHHFL